MTNDYHQQPLPLQVSKQLIPQQGGSNKKSRPMTFSEFKKNGKNWRDYKIYLKEIGALSPKIYEI
jgi:hypothetical protein